MAGSRLAGGRRRQRPLGSALRLGGAAPSSATAALRAVRENSVLPGTNLSRQPCPCLHALPEPPGWCGREVGWGRSSAEGAVRCAASAQVGAQRRPGPAPRRAPLHPPLMLVLLPGGHLALAAAAAECGRRASRRSAAGRCSSIPLLMSTALAAPAPACPWEGGGAVAATPLAAAMHCVAVPQSAPRHPDISRGRSTCEGLRKQHPAWASHSSAKLVQE